MTKKNTLLLSLPYEELSYNTYTDPASGEQCFLIEYSENEEKNAEMCQMVIWTPQAQMLDTLVSRFIEVNKETRAGESTHARGESKRPKSRTGAESKEKAGLSRMTTLKRNWDKAKGAFTISKARFASSFKKRGERPEFGDIPQAGPQAPQEEEEGAGARKGELAHTEIETKLDMEQKVVEHGL